MGENQSVVHGSEIQSTSGTVFWIRYHLNRFLQVGWHSIQSLFFNIFSKGHASQVKNDLQMGFFEHCLVKSTVWLQATAFNSFSCQWLTEFHWAFYISFSHYLCANALLNKLLVPFLSSQILSLDESYCLLLYLAHQFSAEILYMYSSTD